MNNIDIKVKLLRENSKLPVKKKSINDAGFDCYISMFKQMSRELVSEDCKIDCEFDEHLSEEGQLVKNKLIICEYNTYDLKPLERVGCCLGFSTQIPEGYYAQVVPRSGLALRKGLSIVNSPATIDSGYRGEWIAIVVNLSNDTVILKVGERICQMIIRKLVDCYITEKSELNDTVRGEDGFGSSGER